MNRQPRIVLVTRETRMEGMLQRWATKGQARFRFQKAKAHHVSQTGDDADMMLAEQEAIEEFQDLEEEDTTYHDAIRDLSRELDFGLPVQVVDRRFLPTIDFALSSVVVVAGQDGLVANTAKYVGDVPIVGVNPDPARFDGVLLPYRLNGARDAVSRVLSQRAVTTDVTLAEATLHDGQRLLAFNDFFVGAASHVSARYELTAGGESEEQSSSGVLVATGAGSSGWMSSVVNMTRGVGRWLGCDVEDTGRLRMDWSDPALVWAVREPFLSQRSGCRLVAGRVEEGDELVVESRMATNGVIFSDGIESDFLSFNSGTIARIGVAEQRARLVVPSPQRGRPG